MRRTGGAAGLREEFRQFARVSGPMVFVQVSYQLTGLVDTAFAGRLDERSLAATGLGASLFFAVTVLGIGIGLGLDPLAAQALGAGEPRRARRLLWQGIYVALLCCVPLALVMVLLAFQLERFGIATELASHTRAYIFARLPSLVPLLLSVTTRAYLQAAHTTRPIMWAGVWTNVVNIIGNYLLGFGDEGLMRLGLPPLGLPRLGVVGLGLATVLAALAQLSCMTVAVARIPIQGGTLPIHQASWPAIRHVFAVGLPIGLQLLAEVGVFSAVQILIGGMGVRQAAAHQIALMLASLSFSVCLGLAAATSVQVGRAIGRGDAAATRRAGLTGIGLGAAFMFGSAILMWTIPAKLAWLLAPEDPATAAAAAQLLRIAGIFQIADGVQGVASGALRGAGITRWAFGAHLIAHWGFGLPLGVWLAFRQQLGPSGLWWGLTAGLALAAIALAARFLHVSARPIARLQHAAVE